MASCHKSKGGFNELQEYVWNITLGIRRFEAKQPVQANTLSDVVWAGTAQKPAEWCISMAWLPWHPLPVLVRDPSRSSSSAQTGTKGQPRNSSEGLFYLFNTCPDFRECVHWLKLVTSPASCFPRGKNLWEASVRCISSATGISQFLLDVWFVCGTPGL